MSLKQLQEPQSQNDEVESDKGFDWNKSRKISPKSPITLASIEKAISSKAFNSFSELTIRNGSKSYDREFLMSLRDKKESIISPQILHIFPEIILPLQNKYRMRGCLRSIHSDEKINQIVSTDSSETDPDSESEYTTLQEKNEQRTSMFIPNNFETSKLELYERELFLLLDNDAKHNDFILNEIKVRTKQKLIYFLFWDFINS